VFRIAGVAGASMLRTGFMIFPPSSITVRTSPLSLAEFAETTITVSPPGSTPATPTPS
jgi:hypothetical protein